MAARSMFGIINLFKPSGITSRDAVTKVARMLGERRIGHAGTLDPLAEGVLVLAVGRATKLIPYIQDLPKRYVGSFQLGVASNTQDIKGECTEVPWSSFTREQLEGIARDFQGEILQRPPIFSAVRVNGRRAYKLGRRGQAVDLDPRPVNVHQIQIRDVQPPGWTMEVTCGKGTYIRTLGHDMGIRLGSAACLTALQRVAIGDYEIATSVTLEEIKQSSDERWLLNPVEMFRHWPRVELTDEQLQGLAFGIHPPIPEPVSRAVLVSPAGELSALLEQTELGRYRFLINFLGRG